jgi:hypothetical protein
MTLNKLLYGRRSVVHIKTDRTVEEIRTLFAARYQNKRDVDPKPSRSKKGDPVYAYERTNEGISLYFTKALKRNRNEVWSVTYPKFTGEVVNDGAKRSINGSIGVHPIGFYLFVIFSLFLGVVTAVVLARGETWILQDEVGMAAIMFPIVMVVEVYRTRKKVVEMRNEIDQLFSKENQNHPGISIHLT